MCWRWSRRSSKPGSCWNSARNATPTGTPQGWILSPLLANIALSVLDEHLHGPWKPGGSLETEYRRARLRAKGLSTWRLVRYADDFVVLVNGSQADTEALREDVTRVGTIGASAFASQDPYRAHE
ncbi:reverse transcriptase domain-containing protein [Kibdelosporangium aridum]|uniref:reverse transcriptase domain-containing protein n=1 Tax=Kibdelosporangium aridum TaxID=2030 RepID=UPI0035E7AC3A